MAGYKQSRRESMTPSSIFEIWRNLLFLPNTKQHLWYLNLSLIFFFDLEFFEFKHIFEDHFHLSIRLVIIFWSKKYQNRHETAKQQINSIGMVRCDLWFAEPSAGLQVVPLITHPDIMSHYSVKFRICFVSHVKFAFVWRNGIHFFLFSTKAKTNKSIHRIVWNISCNKFI